jgi:CheY-like chemotaxis protein
MTQHKRILLVEDNPNDVELTLRTLADCHLANEVIVVHDGAEALDYLYQRGDYVLRAPENPVLIFLDLKLPKIDGVEVLRQLQHEERLKLIPVVIMTSSREEQDVVESYQPGVNAYVVKPVDFAQFSEAIKTLGLFWLVIPPPSPEGRPPEA